MDGGLLHDSAKECVAFLLSRMGFLCMTPVHTKSDQRRKELEKRWAVTEDEKIVRLILDHSKAP